MKVYWLSDDKVRVFRETGDKRIRNESDFFHRVKLALKLAGYDVIKKLMHKDGHLTAEENYYVRTRAVKGQLSFAVWDGNYAIRSLVEEFNKKGRIILNRVTELDKA